MPPSWGQLLADRVAGRGASVSRMPAVLTACRTALLAVVVPALLVVGGCSASPERADGDEALVVHVIDGDTFDVVLPGGATERVRPPQIDAPERDECGYATATLALERLIMDERVVLVPTSDGPDRDPHGRLLRATEAGGRDVGEVLVRAGMARWVDRYAHEDSRLAELYEAAESEAREASAGLWLACAWPTGS